MRNYTLKYGESTYIDLALYDPETLALQDTITWAAGDVKIIKDGVDAGNSTNTPTLITGRKTWRLQLTATELSAKIVTIELVNSVIVDDVIIIETFGHASAQIVSIPATLEAGSIGAGSITATSIADNAITAAKIADNAITSAKIADNAITATKVADSTITAGKIATDAITSDKVATGAIKDGAIASAERDNIAKSIFKLDMSSITGEAARSLLNAVRFLRNKWSVSGATLTVTKEDDTAVAWTGTITTSGSADPVTGVDPA